MIPVHALKRKLSSECSFRPSEETLMALRRALASYPEILVLSCKWIVENSHDSAKERDTPIPLGLQRMGKGLPHFFSLDMDLLRQETRRPIALILYARSYLPASRLRHLNLYMRRLFPSYQGSLVWPAISACGENTVLTLVDGLSGALVARGRRTGE